MRPPTARHLFICIAFAVPFVTGCGIVEPGDTYEMPRAVTRPVEVSGDQRFAAISNSALDPAGATAFKARLNRIVPLWAEYINLIAVGG